MMQGFLWSVTNGQAQCIQSILQIGCNQHALLQVWKMKGWPLEVGDGVFIQLEALKPVRKCWFISADTQEAQIVNNDYKLLEPIFR